MAGKRAVCIIGPRCEEYSYSHGCRGHRTEQRGGKGNKEPPLLLSEDPTGTTAVPPQSWPGTAAIVEQGRLGATVQRCIPGKGDECFDARRRTAGEEERQQGEGGRGDNGETQSAYTTTRRHYGGMGVGVW